jgi:HD-GYP domain-containing protein (c-di-GMP phosphodiesterase class II)
MAEQIAFGHHEWFDGSGYPAGIRGEAIPLPARLVAVADAYDAITTRRVYKQAIAHDRAASILAAAAGTQFDPTVVTAFVQCEKKFAALARELADEVRPSGSLRPRKSVSLQQVAAGAARDSSQT